MPPRGRVNGRQLPDNFLRLRDVAVASAAAAAEACRPLVSGNASRSTRRAPRNWSASTSIKRGAASASSRANFATKKGGLGELWGTLASVRVRRSSAPCSPRSTYVEEGLSMLCDEGRVEDDHLVAASEALRPARERQFVRSFPPCVQGRKRGNKGALNKARKRFLRVCLVASREPCSRLAVCSLRVLLHARNRSSRHLGRPSLSRRRPPPCRHANQ